MVVTSRQHVIQQPTLEWIERHYPEVGELAGQLGRLGSGSGLMMLQCWGGLLWLVPQLVVVAAERGPVSQPMQVVVQL